MQNLASEDRQTGKSVPDNPDFDALLERVGRHADREAFVALFSHYAPRVKSFLIKSGCSVEQADDLAQETLLTLWRKAALFNRRRANAGTWIFTIARNKRIDALRKTARPAPDPHDPMMQQSGPGLPDEHLMAVQSRNQIAHAVKSLPLEQAELIRKAFFEDKAHAEIARETGLPLGTVKSRIRLALEKIRAIVAHPPYGMKGGLPHAND